MYEGKFMKPIKNRFILGIVLAASMTAWAQAPAAATSQLGTVKAVSGNSLTIATNAGAQVTITVPDGTPIKQVAPGSTNLSAAQTITLADISAGDKILVSGKSGDAAGSFNATRVILMKSSDIAQKRAAEQADWQKRGSGGIVTAVDAGSGSIAVSSGAKKTQVQTTGSTVFRRYAGDSIKFEDTKPGTIAQIKTGDQLQVRGAKSEDGLSIQAEEIVSGSFRDLSGTLATVNPAAGTVTLKDLTTKKMMTVTITPNSDLRKLPPEIAARFAARQSGNAAGAGAAGVRPAAAPDGGRGASGGGRAAGMDLSKMLARLPSATLADLHTGDAVMIVASQSESGSDMATAVTLLGGVEPILAATPAGSESMTLSPWSMGGGAPEGGGAQ
jgi:co-chaperonin GroES (HSP10)